MAAAPTQPPQQLPPNISRVNMEARFPFRSGGGGLVSPLKLGVKCSARRFQSRAAAPPPRSRCECFLTDVAHL